MRNKKGFTLAELLIVVAVLGVLVAISIPIFTSQLERARKAVDLANMRSAKAAAAAEFLSSGATKQTDYFYDAASGTVVTGLDAARNHFKVGYGKSHGEFVESTDGGTGTPKVGDARGVVTVSVQADGTMSAEWELIGNVTVTSSNVKNYLVTNDDDTYTLKFGTGNLSYVTIKDASILKDMDKETKSKITSIVFGKNNLQSENASNPFGSGNSGIEFWKNRQTSSPWDGLTNLESIDFSGINISTLGFTDDVYKNLKQITLSEQQLKFNLKGSWYYLDDNGEEVSLKINEAESRIDEKHPDVYGKTIYRK